MTLAALALALIAALVLYHRRRRRMLFPVQIPPGMVRAGTEYQSRGRWYDGSLVRFFNGTIQPVGGWQEVETGGETVTGRPCGLFGWRSNFDGDEYRLFAAIGTNEGLWVYDNNVMTDITPVDFVSGAGTATEGNGWGRAGWGLGPYGIGDTGIDARTLGVPQWHLDAWGEFLVGCYAGDGRLFQWELDVAGPTPAEVLPNAPIDCVGCFVTTERIMVALGASGDARRVAWSDQEDNTTWTAAPNNTAGDLQVATAGVIVTAVQGRTGALIFTDVDVHQMSYIGSPFYYGIERVGDKCGIIAVHAKVATDTFVVWMSKNGFYVYDGYVKPVPCEVQDFVYGNLNTAQASKIYASHVGQWGEVWWFYPSLGSTENDAYVVWNYRENHWTLGRLRRATYIDRGVWSFPLATDETGILYAQERGVVANGQARGALVNLRSGPIELGTGERVMQVNQIIHDESEAANSLILSIVTRFTPEGTPYTFGPYTLNQASGYTDVRASGRQVEMSFVEGEAGAWRLGTMRLDLAQGGRR